ncbi:MAG TPA: hypothetical protein VF865_08845 [Acidobacteriaceae bacterium]
MMKVFLTILKFVVFFVIFAAGSFLPPFHIERVLALTPEGTRIFIWDGVLLMTALFAVILLIEVSRKRIRTSGPWTTLAFAFALAAGLALKFGFLTR